MENDLPRTDPIQQKTSSEKDYPPSPEETEEIIQAMNSSNEEIYALRTDGSLYYANDQTKISYNLNKSDLYLFYLGFSFGNNSEELA